MEVVSVIRTEPLAITARTVEPAGTVGMVRRREQAAQREILIFRFRRARLIVLRSKLMVAKAAEAAKAGPAELVEQVVLAELVATEPIALVLTAVAVRAGAAARVEMPVVVVKAAMELTVEMAAAREQLL
jgi:hypothetical protein